jgi:hypothetical protein
VVDKAARTSLAAILLTLGENIRITDHGATPKKLKPVLNTGGLPQKPRDFNQVIFKMQF